MFISRLFALAAAGLAGLSLVSASPVAETQALAKRDATDQADQVYGVLTQLKANLQPHVDGIHQAVQSGSVSESSVGQHFNGIFSAFNDANTSLGAMQPASAARLAIRNEPVPQKHRDCANLIVVIITMVTDCLSGLLIWVLLVPKLLVWFVACDKAISLLCTGVGGILVGVLVLVKELLASVLFILQGLLFTLTCSCLGF